MSGKRITSRMLQELVISMKNRIVAYDPETGTDLWHCDGIKDYVCPSVVAHEGVIYAIGGRGRVGLAVRAGGKGDVTQSRRLYELGRGSVPVSDCPETVDRRLVQLPSPIQVVGQCLLHQSLMASPVRVCD